MMFGYTDNKGDFGGPGGGYTLRQPVVTVYAGYGDGPWYVGATLGAGSLDYSDINRNIDLGAAVRTESGTTRGYEYTGRLLGGYWFKYQDLLHGPYARVDVHEGDRPAVLRRRARTARRSPTASRTNDQLLWSVGWQVAGKLGSIRPWARATWEYDSLDKDRTVTASSNTLGGTLLASRRSSPTTATRCSMSAPATDFGGVTGFIVGLGHRRRGDGNYWAITVGLRMPI